MFKKYIKKNYILVHLDEKWLDIIDIRYNLYNFLNNLQNYTKKNILVTSYKNNFPYYLNFKKEFKIKRNKKIILLENLDLFVLERFIKHSFCSISCHSGYIVQIGASNSTKLIDIINKNDYNWYSCWKPKNTKHFFVFKSIKNKIYLKNILTKIISITKNF